MADLGNLGDAVNEGAALGINDAGTIAGYSPIHTGEFLNNGAALRRCGIADGLGLESAQLGR